MQRRDFLKGLALASLPITGRADDTMTLGIYPGTGKADINLYEFRDAAMPFARTIAAAVGQDVSLVLFRSIKNVLSSLEKGRLDAYFVPPTVAVSVLDNNYSPVARVRDQATGMLVRRVGETVSSVALTEKESWLDVMSRYVIQRSRSTPEITNFKTQEDVVLALKNGLVQAGSLRVTKATELLTAGGYETWLNLPATPDFTLMVSDRYSQSEQNRIGQAAAAMDATKVQSLQKTIHSKVTGFVIDREADYKSIKAAMAVSGYLD